MTTQRGKRRAHRGDRRYMEASRRAGLTPHPWWWDYPRLQARYNPYKLPWHALREMPALVDQRAYAIMAERLVQQVIGVLESSGSFHRV